IQPSSESRHIRSTGPMSVGHSRRTRRKPSPHHWGAPTVGRGAALIIAACALALPAGAGAQGPLGPLPAPNDLPALGQGSGQTPDTVPVQHPAEPPQTATPLAKCGPGSNPEPDIDGRVPKGSNPKGLWCNMALVAHHGTSWGLKTLRYVDTA